MLVELVCILKRVKSNATLSWSAQAATAKYHRLGGLTNTHLFLTVLEAGKSKLKVPADLVLGEGPFPGLQIASLLAVFHMAERGNSRVSSSS